MGKQGVTDDYIVQSLIVKYTLCNNLNIKRPAYRKSHTPHSVINIT